MSNILVYTFPHLGHINPILPFVEEICENNNVYIFVLEKYKSRFDHLKCKLIYYNEDIEKFAIQNSEIDLFSMLDNSDMMMNSFREYYEEYQKIILRNKVILGSYLWDVIYSDTFSIWGIIYAAMEKCNLIALECFIYSNMVIRRKILYDYFSELKGYETGVVERKLDQSAKVLILSYKKIERQYSITKEVLEQIFQPQKSIVLLDRQLQPYAQYCEENIQFYGNTVSLEMKPRIEQNSMAGKKIILVTLGREKGKQHIDAIQHIVELAKQLEQYEFTITTLEFKNIDTDHCDHVHVFEKIDQQEMLRIADVMITHGGVTGVKEAMFYCVPMLLMPENVQQYAVAKRVEALGKGKVITRRMTTSKELDSLINGLLIENLYEQK